MASQDGEAFIKVSIVDLYLPVVHSSVRLLAKICFLEHGLLHSHS